MNAYDFDQTIFYPDSSYLFVMHCLRRYPRAVLSSLPGVLLCGLFHFTGFRDTKALKEKVFSFLARLDNVDRIVAEFWEKHRGGIEPWYLRQKRDDDLIVSASPEFLLRPIAEELGVRLIATPMDKHTGRIFGRNCHDEEKVMRFYKDYPTGRIGAFYSDSLSDTPMARTADRAYLVKRGEISPWPEKQ